MTTKSIAARACITSARSKKYTPLISDRRSLQRGVTLIELLVGIAIGLLVIAVAGGALMVSRGVSGTVSGATNIQQQASYALRVIGMQVRQAGSLYLNPNPGSVNAINEAMAPVAFEKSAQGGNGFDASKAEQTISGTDTSLDIGYRRYLEPVFTSATSVSMVRNCAGGPADSSADQGLESHFSLDATKHELDCGGNDTATAPQAIINHVANFQVRYLLQSASGAALGQPTVQYVNAAGAKDKWGQVQAVEVCLVLYGTEPIDLPAGSTYTDCDGTTKVDMTTLTGERAKRMHLVFRNVYQLRSQGLIGSVL